MALRVASFTDDSAKATMRECLGLEQTEGVPDLLFESYKQMEKLWAMANDFPDVKDVYGLIVNWTMMNGGEPEKEYKRKPSDMLSKPKRGPGRPPKVVEPVAAGVTEHGG